MTTNNTKAASDADELIEQLLDGDRAVLADVAGVRAVDGLQALEVIHRTVNGDRVTPATSQQPTKSRWTT